MLEISLACFDTKVNDRECMCERERERESVLCLHFRVGIELPTIDVSYENMSVEADFYVGNRAADAARNFVEVLDHCRPKY